jgi:hypothetical protein
LKCPKPVLLTKTEQRTLRAIPALLSVKIADSSMANGIATSTRGEKLYENFIQIIQKLLKINPVNKLYGREPLSFANIINFRSEYASKPMKPLPTNATFSPLKFHLFLELITFSKTFKYFSIFIP